MKFIRRILTISNLILAVALFLLYMSITEIGKAYHTWGKLISHSGVVQEMRTITTKNESHDAVKGDSLRTIKIWLQDDTKEYTICFMPLAINSLVKIGDSVELFTINPPRGGNLVIGSHGSDIMRSADSNQVFQILSKKYPFPVVGFEEYKSSVKTTVWVLPALSLAFFIWYFLSRSNVKGLFSFYAGEKEIRIG